MPKAWTGDHPDRNDVARSSEAPRPNLMDSHTDASASLRPLPPAEASTHGPHGHAREVARHTRAAEDQARPGQKSTHTSTEGEAWLTTQEAAHFLNVHRSTVHLAIKNNNLAPDYITPGGHYRFTHATLQAFAETLRTDAATSVTRVAAPVRSLGVIADQLLLSGDLGAICREAVRGIQLAEPALEIVMIVRRDEVPPASVTPEHPISYHGLAWAGLPKDFKKEFQQFHSAGMSSLAARAMLSREIFIAQDTEQQALPYVARIFVNNTKARSLAILPIVAVDQGIGALILASTKPKQFSPTVIAYLETITRQLALSLRGVDHIAAERDLVARALAFRADIGHLMRATLERQREYTRRIAELSEVFRLHTGAEKTFGYNVLGLAPPADSRPQLAELSCDVCRSEQVGSTEWTENGTPFSAIATAFKITPVDYGVVGAIWRGHRAVTFGYRSLLITYGASCMLATGSAAAHEAPPH